MKNMSNIDKSARIIIAIIAAVLIGTGVLSGWVAMIAGLLAAIFVLTSLVGFCPLYKVFGIKTN